MSTIAELSNTVAAQLREAGIESAEVESQLLLAHVLDVSRGELLSMQAMGESLTEPQTEILNDLVARRMKREPLQHLTGTAHFRKLTLKVGLGVFVPRPETEVVTQLAIDTLSSMASESPIAIDLGTGSGAIALSLATEVPHANVYAVELSPAALPFTRANFAAIAPHATLLEGDMAEVTAELNGKVSLVVSNPPYIPTDMIPRDPEVRDFEPALALYGGGDDGLDVIRVVSSTAARLLHTGGSLVIEHADVQAEAVTQLLLADGWRQIRSHKDLSGRDRAITALK
jgi:release factor glutamine methyltransferase